MLLVNTVDDNGRPFLKDLEALPSMRNNFLGMCTDHHISAVRYQDPRQHNVVLDSKLVTISVYKNGGQQ